MPRPSYISHQTWVQDYMERWAMPWMMKHILMEVGLYVIATKEASHHKSRA